MPQLNRYPRSLLRSIPWVWLVFTVWLLAGCQPSPTIPRATPTASPIVRVAERSVTSIPGAFVAWGAAQNAVPPTREPDDPLAPGNEILGVDCLTYLGSGGDVGISGVWENRNSIHWGAYDACINAAAQRTVKLTDGRTVAQPVILTIPSSFSDTGSRWYRTGGHGAPGTQDNPYIRLHLPAWMQNDTYRFTFQMPESGNTYQSVRYGGAFKDRMVELIQAAGARYNSHPQVAAVRVYVGVQGESMPILPCQPFWDASLPVGGDGLACRGDRIDQVLAEHEKVVSCQTYTSFVRALAEAAYTAFPNKAVVVMADASPCGSLGGKQFRRSLYDTAWAALPIGISMNNINADRQDADERGGNSLAAWAKYTTGRTLNEMGYPMLFEYDWHRPSVEGMYWTTLSGAGNGGSYLLHHSPWNASYSAFMWEVIDHWLASDRRAWLVFRDREFPTYDFAPGFGTSGSIGDWGKHLSTLNPEVAPQACEPQLQSVARAANTIAARSNGRDIVPACPDLPLPTPVITPAATPSPGPDLMNRLFNRQARRLPPGAALELAVSDRWQLYGRTYAVAVTVSYLDIGADSFTVSLPDAAGVLREHVIRKGDTGLWQRHTWTQTARLANPERGGAFAVIANDAQGDEYLHELYFDVADEQALQPAPSPSPTATRTLTPAPTFTPSPVPPVAVTPTTTATATVLPSRTPAATASPTPTATPSITPSITPSPRSTVMPSPSATPSATRTLTPAPTATPQRTSTPTATAGVMPPSCAPTLRATVRLAPGVKAVAASAEDEPAAFYVGLFDSSELLRVAPGGEVVWRTATGEGRTNGVAVSGEVVITTNRDRGTVTLHRATTGAIIATLPAGSLPWGVAADGSRAYVANFGSGSLTIVDLMRAEVRITLQVGQQPVTVLARDGRVYVLHLNGAVFLLDEDGTLLVQGVAPLEGARALALDSARNRLYVTGEAGRVFVLNARTLAEVTRFALPGPAYAADVNPQNGRFFAVDPQNDRLYVVEPDDAQGAQVDRIPLPAQGAAEGGQGLAVWAGQVAVANYAAGSLSLVDDTVCTARVTLTPQPSGTPAELEINPPPTVTLTATALPTRTATATSVPTATYTAAPPRTATATRTRTPTPAPTRTATQIATITRTPTSTARPTPAVIRAKIEIVWPHGGAAVSDADLANITAYLILPDGNDPPPCDWSPTVRLWAALNTEPARVLAVGQKRMFENSGRLYPVWDFNDVDVRATRDPANKLVFFVTVDGVETFHNVWTHAADARTIFPQPDVPSVAIQWRPTSVDARVEIVWPHAGAPIAEARLANISAYLFAPGVKQALSPDLNWRPSVRLHRTLNSDVELPGSTVLGAPRIVTAENGVRFLAWDFNDIDITAAQEPLHQIFFWLSVDDTPAFPNIWAHGAEPRTIFPQPDVLNSCR